MKKTLIVIRCDNTEFIPFEWFDHKDIEIVLSCFGNEVDPKIKENHFHHYKGGKWSGIFNLFERSPEFLNKFEYFWFVDDDIISEPENVIEFIELAQNEGFELSQPALTPDSFWAHRITIVNRNFVYRHTNFVELMMPMIHRDLLLKILPIFEERHACLGLDFFWQQLASNPQNEVAIIDKTPMKHSRPRRQLLKKNLRSMNSDMFDERVLTLLQFGVKRQMPKVLSGCIKTDKGNQSVFGMILLVNLISGTLKVRREVTSPPWKWRDLFLMLTHQLTANHLREAYDHKSLMIYLKKKKKACELPKKTDS